MQIGVVRYIHNASCLASVLLNAVLFTFIMKKTPFHLRSYSIILFNFAVIEVITAFASAAIVIRRETLNTDEYTIGAITGPCRLFGSSKLCFITLGCMMHGHSHYCVLLAFGFCYRYYILMHRTPHNFSLIILLVFAYAPTAIVYILYGSTPLLEAITLRKVVAKIYPNYDFDQRAGSEILFGAEMKWTISLGIMWVQCIIIPAYVIIIASSILTHRLLDTNLQMSEGNKRAHRQIMKGLMKQALLPTLYTFSVAAHIAKMNGFFADSEEASYVPMTIGSIILAASPTITLSSIPPYRRAVKSILYRQPELTTVMTLNDSGRRTNTNF